MSYLRSVTGSERAAAGSSQGDPTSISQVAQLGFEWFGITHGNGKKDGVGKVGSQKMKAKPSKNERNKPNQNIVEEFLKEGH